MPNLSSDYKAAVRGEQDYWQSHSERISSSGFDFRSKGNFRMPDPVQIWEDMPVMDLFFGDYKKRIYKLAGGPGLRVLELGAGSGWLSYELAARGSTVEAYDILPEVIARLNAVTAKDTPHLKLKFHYGDANMLDFGTNVFDRVVIWDSLHHFSKAPEVITKIFRALKHGGLFIFTEHVEHRGILGVFSRALALVHWMVLPTREKFFEKMNFLVRRVKKSKTSPFEDVAEAGTYLPQIRKLFHVQEEAQVLSFARMFVARIRKKNENARMNLIKKIAAVDKALLRFRILKGEYLFMVAQKP